MKLWKNMFVLAIPMLALLWLTWQATAALVATTDHSTYWGGALQECNYNGSFEGRLDCATAVDGQGNFYLAGQTDSYDIPVLNNIYGPCGLDVGEDTTACESQIEGNTAFVAKFNSALEPQFVTYFPASSVSDMAVDSQGDIYIVGDPRGAPRGVDNPTGFPVTNDAYQANCGLDTSMTNCTPDAYLAKLSGDGQAVLYATYLGGGADDIAVSVAVRDTAVVVGGYTNSNDFPTTSGAFQEAFVGTLDMGFITKFSFNNNPTVDFSTYLGDTGDDSVTAVAVDSVGHIIAAGDTFSTNFPIQNPIEPCDSDLSDFCWDGFVIKLNVVGSGLVYGTYLGGGNVYVRDMTVDANDRVYITGYGHRNSYAFLTRMNSAGTAWDYTADFGEGSEYATHVAVDDNGIAYVAGIQRETDGIGFDTSVATVSNQGNILDRTAVGGSADDLPSGLVLQSDLAGGSVSGVAYVIGFTLSENFPLVNAGNGAYYQSQPDGPNNDDGTFDGDAFITNISGLVVEDNSSVIYLPLITR